MILSAIIGLGAFIAAISVCCLYSKYKRRIRRNQRHLRLLDSPQPPAVGGPGPPGSIIMLPPGPPPSNHHMVGPPVPHPGPPPPIGPDGQRNYEWQERGLPLDNVSYRSVPHM